MTCKLIIAGGREFNDYDLLKKETSTFISNLILSKREITHIKIVCGLAKGADKLGEKFAKSRGYEVTYFPANWEDYGKSAGYRRNEEMAKYADACVCFWDGESRGTKHMIDLAYKHSLIMRVVLYIPPKLNIPKKRTGI